jgi:hypothetical protein
MIVNELNIENPSNAMAVKRMLAAVMVLARNFLLKKPAAKLDMTVPTEIVIVIIPAYETGTFKVSCIAGQADPISESGNPRLIKAI